MTPTEQRLTELIDRWLRSLELHRRYATLDEAAYARIQAWPNHTRPAPWIIEHARARAIDLKAQIESRIANGDTAFADALEQMSLLATLVGIQDIERFIPLADPAREAPPGDTVLMPAPVVTDPNTTSTVPAVPPATPPAVESTAPQSPDAQVIADAVRLLKWGREWHELAPSIARMAGRPGIVEVRRLLRTHKAAIETAAGE
jgi:hypothetical protein